MESGVSVGIDVGVGVGVGVGGLIRSSIAIEINGQRSFRFSSQSSSARV